MVCGQCCASGDDPDALGRTADRSSLGAAVSLLSCSVCCCSIIALHSAALGGGHAGAPLKQLPAPPARRRAPQCKGNEARNKQNIMNTPDINTNTAAPAVTIAPRSPAKGVLLFVVTLTDHQTVRTYPCRSMEAATKLATRFVAGVTKSAR